jgi:8-hydroxy-5-deazaflavin:NADPH oxidoreductase
VVVSVPPRAYPAVPVEPLAGKPVLDSINYIPQRDGGYEGSVTRAVQQRGA